MICRELHDKFSIRLREGVPDYDKRAHSLLGRCVEGGRHIFGSAHVEKLYVDPQRLALPFRLLPGEC